MLTAHLLAIIHPGYCKLWRK